MSSSSSIAAGVTPEQVSHDKLARLAGALYLSTLPTGGLGIVSAQSLLENGGSGAAAQIAASLSFLKLGVLAGAVCAVTWLVLGVLFYALFRSVNERACQLMLAMVVVSNTLLLAALARRMDALWLVADVQRLALDPDQLRALAALAVRSSDNLMQVSTLFWGLWLLPLGFLVFRSGFVPKTLAVLLLLGVVFYVGIYVGGVVDPEYPKTLVSKVIGFGFGIPEVVGELGTALWLLIRGTKGWRKAAAASLPLVT